MGLWGPCRSESFNAGKPGLCGKSVCWCPSGQEGFQCQAACPCFPSSPSSPTTPRTAPRYITTHITSVLWDFHISIATGTPTITESPTCCGCRPKDSSELGRQWMEIVLIASINIDGKGQMSIWIYFLLSFGPEKELLQPKPHFPPHLCTTIGLIKMNFICLQKSLFWALNTHRTSCFLFLASFKRTGLAARQSECTRHMLEPSEHCCRSLHMMVFQA